MNTFNNSNNNNNNNNNNINIYKSTIILKTKKEIYKNNDINHNIKIMKFILYYYLIFKTSNHDNNN